MSLRLNTTKVPVYLPHYYASALSQLAGVYAYPSLYSHQHLILFSLIAIQQKVTCLRRKRFQEI